MPDKISRDQRSYTMSRVRGRDTGPEMSVRSLLHRLGYRFRKNVKKLPGKPDIVLPKYKTVIFVNGCFWHQHPSCKRSQRPTSNISYWNEKLDRNVSRDQAVRQQLTAAGWTVVTLWTCEIGDQPKLADRLKEIRQRAPHTANTGARE